jgi:putative transposase
MLIAVADRLKGFPAAIAAVLPQAMGKPASFPGGATVSMSCPGKTATRARPRGRASTGPAAAAGEAALAAFAARSWGRKYPAIGQRWRRACAEVVPFYAFPGDVRRILSPTKAIKALNSTRRRAVRARRHFPSDEAATTLLFRVLNRAAKQGIRPPRKWAMATAPVAVRFGERFTLAMA